MRYRSVYFHLLSFLSHSFFSLMSFRRQTLGRNDLLCIDRRPTEEAMSHDMDSDMELISIHSEMQVKVKSRIATDQVEQEIAS